jgi:hypothetical protein
MAVPPIYSGERALSTAIQAAYYAARIAIPASRLKVHHGPGPHACRSGCVRFVVSLMCDPVTPGVRELAGGTSFR